MDGTNSLTKLRALARLTLSLCFLSLSTASLVAYADHGDRPDSNSTSEESSEDDKWVSLFTNRNITRFRSDQVMTYVKKWRELASKTTGQSDLAAESAAMKAFHFAIARFVGAFGANQRKAFSDSLDNVTFESPSDILVRSAFKLALNQGSEKASEESGNSSHRSAAAAAAKAIRDYNRGWNQALRTVVDMSRGYPAVRPNVQIQFTDREGKTAIMSGTQWIDKQIQDYGFDNLVRFASAVGGDSGNRVLGMLAARQRQGGGGSEIQYGYKSPAKGDKQPDAIRFADDAKESYENRLARALPKDSEIWERAEFRRPSHGELPGKQASEAKAETGESDSHAGHNHDHGTAKGDEAKPRARSGELTERQKAIDAPAVKPILDKCITCHVMDPKLAHVANLTGLKHKMRDGGYGTYQRKIHNMMGQMGDAKHIHFTPEEIYTIAKVFKDSQGDDDIGEYPPHREPISPEEKKFATNTARANALKDPVVNAALMRCLVCHRDPNSQNTDHVNTISKLRAEMRTIDKGTIENMIKRGYDHPRLLHIQNLKNDMQLEKALLDFTQLAKDTPIGGGSR